MQAKDKRPGECIEGGISVLDQVLHSFTASIWRAAHVHILILMSCGHSCCAHNASVSHCTDIAQTVVGHGQPTKNPLTQNHENIEPIASTRAESKQRRQQHKAGYARTQQTVALARMQNDWSTHNLHIYTYLSQLVRKMTGKMGPN